MKMWAGTYGEGGWTNSKRYDRRDNCPDWPIHADDGDTQLRSRLLSRWIAPNIAPDRPRSPPADVQEIPLRRYSLLHQIRQRLTQVKETIK